MRLLNTKTLVIEEFYGDVPPYAILSHTWGDGEASYVDFVEGRASSLEGYQKILGCCDQAMRDGLEYVWIDTCCIEKQSSAELSAAINSMFNWYRCSVVCYAYLEDVQSTHMEYYSSFKASRWFTRGWTLQELLAPFTVVFFSSDWENIGTRDSLQEIIAEITNINREFFETGNLADFSIAQKMSWASLRQTTRVEDQAYCLLGLFGVSMPLIYGEGERAFIRLQEAIIKESDDHSIFAWTNATPRYPDTKIVRGGLLAPSPAPFANSRSIVRTQVDEGISPYTITNAGLQISLPVVNFSSSTEIPVTRSRGSKGSVSFIINVPRGQSIAFLNCHHKGDHAFRIAIFLERPQVQLKLERPYQRVRCNFGILSIEWIKVFRVLRQQSLLIETHNLSDAALTRPNKREKLVIIELPKSPIFNFKLKRNGSGPLWRCQGTWTLTLAIPWRREGFSTTFPILFEHPQGGAFIILVVIRSGDGVVPCTAHLIQNFRMPHDGEDTSWYDSGNGILECYQESPDGRLQLSLDVREAAHASIIKLNACADSNGMEIIKSGIVSRPGVRKALPAPPGSYYPTDSLYGGFGVK
ncbi:heterokaryon incompatibility protein-domain-containing protein [Hypoxylon trugodes]|uniref:heterokaryon incompatibility protein-domain-containing protein n=1 Tax=Hypoxylon trugodes TaxID=326681 RepID=UPI002197A17F|nr:heterokaryon incompatibility protein-domain-containing protein [Hypoxylon trugodes]KAI1389416.1 heterokaryon incompatibility protein-domain-containing protein [Hypoxylon trugodes]